MTRLALSIALVALVLAGCGTTSEKTSADLTPLDLTLTGQCPAPSEIPDRDLSERDVARLWGLDRAALADCRRRFAATVSIIEHRDQALSAP